MMIFSIVKNNKFKFLGGFFVLIVCYLILSFQVTIFKYLFSSKTWAHRVNSIEKYKEASESFSGVELDLVFDTLKNNFDVNHPPTKSINLTLIDFLKSKKEYKNFGLWLDYKNLNKSNHIQSSKKLDSIIRVLNINPNSVIVESSTPFLLDVFSDKGFKTSYYLPSNISSLKNEDLKIQYDLIKTLKDSETINFISSKVYDYKVMKETFPNTRMIVWSLNDPPKIRGFHSLIKALRALKTNLIVLNDPDVEVNLIKFNAASGNR